MHATLTSTYQPMDKAYKGKYMNPTITPDGKLMATELNNTEMTSEFNTTSRNKTVTLLPSNATSEEFDGLF